MIFIRQHWHLQAQFRGYQTRRNLRESTAPTKAFDHDDFGTRYPTENNGRFLITCFSSSKSLFILLRVHLIVALFQQGTMSIHNEAVH